jgi:hypothetical protein
VARVKVMGASEDVRGREATLREARAVRAPANDLELRLEARASHRLLHRLGHERVIFEVLLHVPVRLDDLHINPRARIRVGGLTGEPPE